MAVVNNLSVVDNLSNLEFTDMKVLENGDDAFTVEKLILSKPRWIPDNDVKFCENCNSTFSAIIRRHHCRFCGHVFCANCSRDKITLPYLGCYSVERVCIKCKILAMYLQMTTSSHVGTVVQGTNALADMCDDLTGIQALLTNGGIHVLIYLGRYPDDQIKKAVVKGLKKLSEITSIHDLMTHIGAVKCLCCILNSCPHDLNIQIDSLGILCALCVHHEVKITAMCHGVLPVLVSLFKSCHDLVLYRATECVALIAQNYDTHPGFVSGGQTYTLHIVVRMLSHSHDQVLENILKCLCHLTVKSDCNREFIIQVNHEGGHWLAALLTSSHGPIVKQLTSCLIGNLATAINFQALEPELLIVCESVEGTDSYSNLGQQLVRALANFSQHRPCADIIVDQLPNILTKFLLSGEPLITQQAYRCALQMMLHLPTRSVQILTSTAADQFLQCLSHNEDGLQFLITTSIEDHMVYNKPE